MKRKLNEALAAILIVILILVSAVIGGIFRLIGKIRGIK